MAAIASILFNEFCAFCDFFSATKRFNITMTFRSISGIPRETVITRIHIRSMITDQEIEAL